MDVYDDVVAEAVEHPGVEIGTMMDSACLRVNGDFFAMRHSKTGELIVKLSESRIGGLVAAGVGKTFAPNGRVFREWMAVAPVQADQWSSLVDEARRFVQG